jgi:glycosyltransferase involved in cell wall biosynthesis
VNNGIDVDRVAHVASTIDREAKRRELGFSPEEIMIVSVARFVEWKGHQLLVEAFASVASEIPNARLLLIGDGPLYAPLTARVAELGLQDRIRMPGARSDVYEILASADIFSLAFMYPVGLDAEAIGVAGFEAMAFGLPVIVGDYVGAHAYLGDDERGMIVAPRDRDALGKALVTLSNDGERRHCLGETASAFVVRDLNWSTLIKIYERIYTLIVNL